MSESAPVSITQTIKSTVSSTLPSPESELNRWRRTFERFAQEESDGKKYLNSTGFIDAIAPTDEGFNRIRREQYSILFRVADSSNRGLVSFEDFVVFETLLKRPDADYQLAFQVFDTDASGTINYDEFKAVLQANIASSGIPFNFESDWMKLYLGKRGGSHVLGYSEFGQMIKGFTGERVRQAFHYFDQDGDGYIRPDEFQRIIVEVAGHKLSDSVLERLPTLCTMNPGRKISYSEVFAFHNIIREMDTVEKVIQRATRKSRDGRIDLSDFLNEAADSMRYGIFTPLEAAIIFHFASRGMIGSNNRLAEQDFRALLDAKWEPPNAYEGGDGEATSTHWLSNLGASAWNFTLGGIAGALGAFAVFPIDLIKTRLQNQRSTLVGELLYKGPFDCARKIYVNEGGIRGFYKGLIPQMVGVAPEKSIKLVVNAYVRGLATDPETGRITLPMEILAGATAGACQVSVTNPLEIVKNPGQTIKSLDGILSAKKLGGKLLTDFSDPPPTGEITRAGGVAPRGAVHIIKQLGLVGLYKGARACLARDVPFSAIYFPAYAHLKKDVFHEGRKGKVLSLGEMLIAAGAAGMPAAYLTTVADVCKTRLQAQARAGETQYRGLWDAMTTIAREEGPRALFKGGIARVVLQQNFANPFADASQAVAARPLRAQTDISRIRARNGLKILLDCSSNFGMVNQASAAQNVSKLPKSLGGSGVVGRELA